MLDEHLLRPATTLPTTLNSPGNAPPPLLSNGGEGRLRLYNLDVTLLILLNSRERFLQEYINIAQQAGLKLSDLRDAGDANIMEFVIA